MMGGGAVVETPAQATALPPRTGQSETIMLVTRSGIGKERRSLSGNWSRAGITAPHEKLLSP